jgi:single-strand DNA-binding protein
MANFNKVFLIGNLTRDPELKYTPNGTAVAEFGMATNRSYTSASGEKKEEVCFVDVSVFGRRAEVINEYMAKGRPLFLEGRLKFDQWETADGQRRSKLRVVGENFEFLGRRFEGERSPGNDPGAPPISDDQIDARDVKTGPREEDIPF